MKKKEKPWAAVFDFDGTVTLRDVADSILLRYTRLRAKDIASSNTTLTEELVRRCFLEVKAPIAELQAYAARTARLRNGFSELVHKSRAQGLPVEIVSGGLDLYLDHLLERWGLDWLPRHRGAAQDSPEGLAVHYRFLGEHTLDSFKRERVRHYRRQGYRVLFAGDGTSDFAAAREADLLFARGPLLKLCRRDGVRARTLTTFHHAAAAIHRGR